MAMDGISSQAQEKLRQRIEENCASLRNDCALLRPTIVRATAKNSDPAAAVEAHGIAQRITGLSGSTGFSDVSQRAVALVDALKPVATDRRPGSDAELTRILECFEHLCQSIERLTPESSRLYDADLSSPFRNTTGFRRISVR
jgi:hypothetical protein